MRISDWSSDVCSSDLPACDEAARWPDGVRVAVNVSPIQFANPALPAIVTNALARSGIAPQRLELEITEGVFLDETASSDQMFKSLKAIGVRLALDDFGTGDRKSTRLNSSH